MKQITTIFIALVIMLNMVDLIHGQTPATICKWMDCSWPLFQRRSSCQQVFDFRIGNRYRGVVRSSPCDGDNVDRCAESFLRRRCSSDAVFCIEAIRGTDERFILRYANLDRIVGGGRTEDAEPWCRDDRRGTAYWIDV